MKPISAQKRSFFSLALALLIHGAVVVLFVTPSHQPEVIEPLKEVTSIMRLITQIPTQEKPQPAPELAALAPVQTQQETTPLPPPAAPRKALSERKAHKAVAAKPKPSIPASNQSQIATLLPTAPQQPEVTMPAPVMGQPQATSDTSTQASNLSVSAIKDIAAAYRAMVHGRIAALQEYPSLAKRMGEEGTVLVRFTILASGKISHVVIMESSGYQRLDVAAVDIFMQGLDAKLPPIPLELNKTEWTLSLPIRYQLQ